MRGDRATLLAFAVTVVLGGLNFVAVRFSNRELPPFAGAALRFGVAGLIFFVYAAARRIPLPRGRALVGAVLFGLVAFGGAFGFAYWALVSAPAALGSVAFALVPLLTLVLATLHGLERITLRAVAGGALALLGVAIVFREQLGEVSVAALLALLASAACAAESGVLVKYFPRSHPAATSAAGMAAGTALLVAISLTAGESWRLPSQPATVAAFLYLVASAIVIFATSLYVLGRWAASAAAYQFVLFPLITVVTAALIAGEGVTLTFVMGAIIVAVGVVVAASRSPGAARAGAAPRDTRPEARMTGAR